MPFTLRTLAVLLIAGLLATLPAAEGDDAAAAPAETPTEATDAATPPDEPAEGGTTVIQQEKVGEAASFAKKLEQGGIIVVILILLSIALVSLAIERFQHLRRAQVLPPGFADEARELWQAKKFKTLRQRCEENGSTLANIIRALVMHRKSPPLELSQVASDIGSKEMREHMQRLIPFALIATISPLLGLLGTVNGMIGSFETVAVAGSLGDASVMADDISQALITPAAGLIVAVPAIAVFNLVKSRTTRMALALDGEVNLLISEWFLETVDDEDEAGEEA